MSKGELYFLLSVSGAVSAVLCSGVFYFDYSLQILLLPLALGVVICLLCFARISILLANGFTGDLEPATTPASANAYRKHQALRTLSLLSVLPAVMLLGYPLGLTLYVFTYVKLREHSWLTASSCALVCLGLVYVLFMAILKVPLPVKPLGWL